MPAAAEAIHCEMLECGREGDGFGRRKLACGVRVSLEKHTEESLLTAHTINRFTG